MITGSTASSVYGEPRATQDVDVLIDPTPEQLDRLLSSFRGAFYVSLDEAGQALSTRGMFNVVDLETGWKADLIVCPNRVFDRLEMGRRRKETILGVDVWVISPEGSVLSKLEWSRLGGSEMQFRDAAGVLSGCRDSIDWDYLERQAGNLGVADLLEKARS